MALTKEGIIRSSSPLNCCQTVSSNSVSNDEDIVSADATTNFLNDNGNNNFDHYQAKNKHKFPKRPPANLVFEDIKYTTTSWSMTRLRRGMY